jgi:hypothetical protein
LLITYFKPDPVICKAERGEHHRLRFLGTEFRIGKAFQVSIVYSKPDWYGKRRG